MPGNPGCTVYVGNLDERVNDRVLYEILIQAGRVVDMYIPREKETNRHKGFAFAEYETEEIADYTVKLFSGLVSLYNRTLKFAISGQDKSSQNSVAPITPLSNSPHMSRSQSMQLNNNTESVQHPAPFLTPCRFSAYTQPVSPNYPQAHAPGLVVSNGYRSEFNANNFDYNKRAFGASVDSINRLATQSSRTIYDSRNPIAFPSY